MPSKEPTVYLKVMLPGRETTHARKIDKNGWAKPYVLPEGKWLPRREPVPCKTGYHYIRHIYDLPNWLRSDSELWVVQIRGKRSWQNDQTYMDDLPWLSGKGVAAQMKLVRQLDTSSVDLRELWCLGQNFRQVAFGRLNRYEDNHFSWDEKRYVGRLGPMAPPFKHLWKTKYGKAVNNLMLANNISKWGDH